MIGALTVLGVVIVWGALGMGVAWLFGGAARLGGPDEN